MFLHVKEAWYLEDYRVKLKFNDNKIGIADLKNELYGVIFEPLKDKKKFASLKVDKELETIVWENGADFAPEFLYYSCFKNDKLLAKQFESWGYITKK